MTERGIFVITNTPYGRFILDARHGIIEGTFRYYHSDKRQIRGKIHISEEQYDFHNFGHSLETGYLKNRKGSRTYLFMHPYVEQSNIVISMAVQPKHYADIGLVLGKTTDARVAGFRQIDIGNAQAWYYPDDMVLVLWECFLDTRFQDAPLLQDSNMAQLWTRFEHWLLDRYPQTERIITPFADSIWDVKDYQAFLRARGYSKGKPGTFTKLLR